MDAPERADVLAIDHDRLFKELLTMFFVEFLDLFFPDEAALIDPDSVEFLPQEVFVPIGGVPAKRVVDLLVKVRLKGDPNGPGKAYLINIEHQSTAPPDPAKRFFEYFMALTLNYDLPVFPIGLFSHDRPRTPQSGLYEVKFGAREVLRFNCQVVQLNQYSWREFVDSENPLACALMSKMNVAVEDRPLAKRECLRLMLSHDLEPKEMQVIGRFVDAYLRLTREEEIQFKKEVAEMQPAEQVEMKQYLTSWELRGMEEGLQKGREQGREEGRHEGALAATRTSLLEVVASRFGAEASAGLTERLRQIDSIERLRELMRRALSAQSLTDLGL